jgi:hypothetical protein
VQAGPLRRPPAPLAGDDLECIGQVLERAHDDRLNNAALSDGGRKLVEILLCEALAGIARIRPQELDRHLALPAAALDHAHLVADVADERRETASQAGSCRFFGHEPSLLPAPTRRWRSLRPPAAPARAG